MKPLRQLQKLSEVRRGHADADSLTEVLEEIYQLGGGEATFVERLEVIVRSCIDDIVDTPRTGRLDVTELRQIERDYLRMRVEILFRDAVGVTQEESTWQFSFCLIPKLVVNATLDQSPLVLLLADEERARYSLGVTRASSTQLDANATSKDGLVLNEEGYRATLWGVQGRPYQKNFWMSVEIEKVRWINNPRCTAAERLRRLFSVATRRPVPRKVVVDVARQKDPMKRLRKNGGARDLLEQEDIVLLSGYIHRSEIAALGLLACKKDEFISMRISDDSQWKILRDAGY